MLLIGQEWSLIEILQWFAISEPLVLVLIRQDHIRFIRGEHLNKTIQEYLTHWVIQTQVLAVLFVQRKWCLLCGRHNIVAALDAVHPDAAAPCDTLKGIISRWQWRQGRYSRHRTESIWQWLLHRLAAQIITVWCLRRHRYERTIPVEHVVQWVLPPGIQSRWQCTTCGHHIVSNHIVAFHHAAFGWEKCWRIRLVMMVLVRIRFISAHVKFIQSRCDFGHEIISMRKLWLLLGQLNGSFVDVHTAQSGFVTDFQIALWIGMQAHHKWYRRIKEMVQRNRQNGGIHVRPHKRKQQRCDCLADNH